jgi:hypothetical protein
MTSAPESALCLDEGSLARARERSRFQIPAQVLRALPNSPFDVAAFIEELEHQVTAAAFGDAVIFG